MSDESCAECEHQLCWEKKVRKAAQEQLASLKSQLAAAENKIENLGMMVRRLVCRLTGDDPHRAQAFALLKKYDLLGSILRSDEPPATEEGKTCQHKAAGLSDPLLCMKCNETFQPGD